MTGGGGTVEMHTKDLAKFAAATVYPMATQIALAADTCLHT
jgi:hypothetical protein